MNHTYIYMYIYICMIYIYTDIILYIYVFLFISYMVFHLRWLGSYQLTSSLGSTIGTDV